MVLVQPFLPKKDLTKKRGCEHNVDHGLVPDAIVYLKRQNKNHDALFV